MSTTYRYKCPACAWLSPPSHDQVYVCGDCGLYQAEAEQVRIAERVRELEAGLRDVLDQHRDACGACDDAEALLGGEP